MKVQRINQTAQPLSRQEMYLAQIGRGILAMLGWCVLLYVLFNVEPGKVQNILWQHSYLPVIILFFITNFLSWNFLFLHPRRGGLFAGFLTLVLYFQLQGMLNVFGFLLILVPLLLSEVILTFLSKK